MRVPGFALWKKMMHSNVSSGQLSHKKTIKSASSGGCCDNVWSGSARPGRCSLINKIRPSGVGGYLTGMPWVGGLAHIVLILRSQQDIYCYEVLRYYRLGLLPSFPMWGQECFLFDYCPHHVLLCDQCSCVGGVAGAGRQCCYIQLVLLY